MVFLIEDTHDAPISSHYAVGGLDTVWTFQFHAPRRSSISVQNSKRKRFKENVCYERFLTKVMSMLIGVRHLFEHSTLTCDLE